MYYANRPTRIKNVKTLHRAVSPMRARGMGFFAAAAAPAAPALLTNPVGLAITGVMTIAGLVMKIFGAHAAAVAREANTLNAAIPVFVQSLQAIFQAANSGQISASDAMNYCDQAVAQYYSQVGSIMKKNGACTQNPDCLWPVGVYPPNCNGPCGDGCIFVEPSVCLAKRVFQQGGGTITTPQIQPHAGFSGQGPVTLTYSPPAGVPTATQFNTTNSPDTSSAAQISNPALASSSVLDQTIATPLGSFPLLYVILAGLGVFYVVRQ